MRAMMQGMNRILIGLTLALGTFTVSARDVDLRPDYFADLSQKIGFDLERSFARAMGVLEGPAKQQPSTAQAQARMAAAGFLPRENQSASWSLSVVDSDRVRICIKVSVPDWAQWSNAVNRMRLRGYGVGDHLCQQVSGAVAPAAYPFTVSFFRELDRRDVPVPSSGVGHPVITGADFTAVTKPALTVTAPPNGWGSEVLLTVQNPFVLVSEGPPPVGLTLSVNALTTRQGFEASHNCNNVAPAAECFVSVRYDGRYGNHRAGSLRMEFSNGAVAVLGLVGMATESTVPKPVVRLSPTSVEFGQVQVGSSSSQQVKIENIGNAPAGLTSVSTGGSGFTASGSCSSTLAPGESCTVQLTFAPKAAGASSGSLSFATTAEGSPHTASLSGTGTAPSVQITPQSLAFGGVAVGQVSSQSVSLSNVGTAPLSVTSISYSGAGFGTSSDCPTSLQPGANCVVLVTFSPIAAGSYSGTLSFANNASGSPHQVALSGVGTQAQIELSASTINFGMVATNTSETRQVLISNPGNGVLSFTAPPSVSGNSAFAAGLTSCSSILAPGGECLAEAVFTPTAPGSFTGSLRFSSSLTSSPHDVSLVGTAFNPVSLSSATLPVALRNRAYGPYDFKTLLNVSNESTPEKSLATWQVSSGALPTGLSLNTATGVLSGTPTMVTAGTDLTITATYKNNAGQRVYTIVVNGVALEVTQISAGNAHTCAVTTSGGAKCWGSNSNGRLGDGTTTQRLTPVDVAGLTSGVAAIAAGLSHTCAVTTSGGAKCWGSNSNGRLGDGTTTQRLTPVDVAGLTSGVASIATRGGHTCAVTTSGGAKCWGDNFFGQLGNGDDSGTSRSTPVNVSGLTSGVAAITAGSNHTCALTTSGGAKCWGSNSAGQVGDGTTSFVNSSPVNVSGLGSGVAAITAGGSHTCALTSSGGARCWGSNGGGQVGDGGNSDRLTPVDVVGLTSGVASISAGGGYTCVRTTSGGAKCWGTNNNGQLGDGTTTTRSTLADVSSLTGGVAGLSTGTNHTCAVTTSGLAKCWGSNSNGQLGDGATTQRSTPVDVFE